MFQACFNDPNQGANAATKLAEMFPDEKFVVFYNSGDTYSSGIRDAFVQRPRSSSLTSWMRRPSRTIPPRASPTSSPSQRRRRHDDLRPYLLHPRLRSAANANEMGYDVKMMGCDGMDGILGVEGFDTLPGRGPLPH